MGVLEDANHEGRPMERLLTPADASAVCQISCKTVLCAIGWGELRASRLGRRGAIRVRQADLETWLRNETVPQARTQESETLETASLRGRALLSPLKEDLDKWRLRSGRPVEESFVFSSGSGQTWREHDWRNWRRRVYAPAAESCGFGSARPYDLRHSFASLPIHEGRLSVVEIAQQLGHTPTTCLSTYAHVMAELRDGEKESAEAQIWAARQAHGESASGPHAAQKRPATWRPASSEGEIPLSRAKPSIGLEPMDPFSQWSSRAQGLLTTADPSAWRERRAGGRGDAPYPLDRLRRDRQKRAVGGRRAKRRAGPRVIVHASAG
jgi:hypothetical protein